MALLPSGATASLADALIPRDLPVMAVEAGRGESFRAWVGRDGLIHGVPGFGKSAPWTALADHFGFTPEKLGAKIRAHLKR